MNRPFEDLASAKEMLADPKHRNKDIIRVAMETGYLTIKRFNTAIRRDTGMCPVEYRAFQTEFKRVMGMSPEEYKNQQQPTG